ncbi:MAG: DUF2237 family protein [Sandaracinobacteroides sp.]
MSGEPGIAGEPGLTGERNLLGEPLEPCSFDPLTGWFRDGCCTADPADMGRHLVCAIVTEAFLGFSAAAGNDLSTPRPDFGFAGLQPGDRWCLCAIRWEEARKAGCAPPVVLSATNARATEIIALGHLQAHDAGSPPYPVS